MLAVVTGLAGVTALSAAAHPASIGPLLGFHAAFALLVGLAIPRPRSHAYSALTAMLVLGFWTKFVLRLIDHEPYLEPVGQFDGSTEQWNRALWAIVLAVAGAAAVRLGHLTFTRRRRPASAGASQPAPDRYARHRRGIWKATVVVVIASHAWNAYAAVYVTGVNPRVILPWSGNAALAWWLLLGIPAWLALVVGWEMRWRQRRTLQWEVLWMPVLEAIMSAASLMSRASYLLRVTPYLLASTRSEDGFSPRIPTPWWRTLAALGAGLAVSLVIVMALRVGTYYENAPARVFGPGSSGRATDSESGTSSPPVSGFQLRPVFFAARETGKLFLERWTGMEGVLAVTAADPKPALLLAALSEDPARGTDALYQELAKAPYERQERFTFLTLAGVVAVLAMAGSPAVMFLGMAIVLAIFMATESLLRRLTGNELVCAVVSVETALMIAQVTFPRLLALFFVETWIALALLAGIQGVSATSHRPRTSPWTGQDLFKRP